MRRFLTKTFVFLFILAAYFGINMLINYSIYQNEVLDIKSTRTLIIGDSHTQRSLDPQFLSDAQNISQTAESYVLTYWKLKKVMQTYTPDTVVLGFAPHNISEHNDHKFSDKDWSREMFKRCYSIQEFGSLPDEVPVDHWGYYQTLWRQTGLYPKEDHVNYIGEYTNSEQNDTTDAEAVLGRHYYMNGDTLGVSSASIQYLDSIVYLCEANDIVLVLISNPVLEDYLAGIPTPIAEKYMMLSDKYDNHHLIYDRISAQYPNAFFRNADHLNKSGAERFTKAFLSYLKRESPSGHR